MASKSIYTEETPDIVKSAKGIHLITHSTPNGHKLQIFLEELKAHYGLDFSYNILNISTKEQKKDYFLRLNPNGRIPVVIDNTVSPPFPIHETSAQLVYLQNKYDKENLFGFTDELERSEMFQWLFFWHGSAAPYFGQAYYFSRAEEKVPLAINRFKNEVERVLGVLEIRLSGKYSEGPRDYLAGHGQGKYSIADIGAWSWVKGWSHLLDDNEMKPFPHILKWIDRIAGRDAAKLGISNKYTMD